MADGQLQIFGGDWTEQKLDMLRSYLSFYVKALKNQSFNLAYINAFADTGYRAQNRDPSSEDTVFRSLFAESSGKEARQFIEGSAQIALQVDPPFSRYVFIEKDERRFEELTKLKKNFRKRADRMEFFNAADEIEQRTLAGAAVAGDDEKLPFVDLERHITQGRHVDFAHAIDLGHRLN
jgi:three-Cys-motif partner protein